MLIVFNAAKIFAIRCIQILDEDHAIMLLRIVLAGLGSLPLVSLAAPAQTKQSPGASYFPNSVLRTHEDKPVRFYDDLLKGKIVAINFMYANCEGICPPMTANLVKVQEALGERVGRNIFMIRSRFSPSRIRLRHLRNMLKCTASSPAGCS